jgi:hypothetical protein
MISYMRFDMISYIIIHFPHCPPPAQRADETDDDREPDRPMHFDEERDYVDQGPLTDMDMEEDGEGTVRSFM